MDGTVGLTVGKCGQGFGKIWPKFQSVFQSLSQSPLRFSSFESTFFCFQTKLVWLPNKYNNNYNNNYY